ncbi:MAG: AMMECR1 domain-containing protein, partial [Candidatus Heimdallarchaeota archaeon]|nr:AMMECR1 domain-containing protein [Candidatus Heimdallarchaeota archaeon]
MDVKTETGEYLVKLARFAAKKWIKEGEKPEPLKPIEEQAKLTTGVFVTVRTIVEDSSDLRGCIGYPLGIG